MNRSPTWKVLTLVAVLVLSTLYALPNVFGDDPALLISPDSGAAVRVADQERVDQALAGAGIGVLSSKVVESRVEIRLAAESEQLRAADVLKRALGHDYIVALTMIPRTPGWLVAFGADPMALGLDLRGGVHFLMEVDLKYVIDKANEQYARELPSFLRNQEPPIRYTGRRSTDAGVELDFKDQATRETAQAALAAEFRELQFAPGLNNPTTLQASLAEEEVQRIIDFSVKQNLTTMRNRVNQLGVAEPVIQRQGRDRILVQLPGVKDPTQAKSILDATATLEYRAVAEGEDAALAARTGVLPPDTDLYYERDTGRPILLKSDIIATGNQIVDAAATFDSESSSPAVSVTLNGQGSKRMFDYTERNVGRLMAVLFKETDIRVSYDRNGEAQRERIETEEVISVATVRGVFGKRFQTTGLSSKEAHDLSLLLRAGALAAPISIVEERTIGPSLGQDNIDQGRNAVILGFVMVVIFMALYYRVFGLIADLALILNLVLIISVLSLLQATLTLPGIAGIVLTVGMAVDANVLIFERIREELLSGSSVQQAISSGYDKAFITIADANITTLIAAVVLFVFGTGPIKGFAVTLSIGIVASMFTAIFGTRIVVNALYGGRRLSDIPV